MDWWQGSLLAVVGGLLILWLALLGALAVAGRGRDRATLTEGMRLLPDVVRLVRRLAGDRGLPRGVRVRLGLLLAYLVIPIDLVPDFLPVIGYVDDAVVVALALRSVVHAAGVDALAAHWPGTHTGLAAVHRLVGLPPPGPLAHGGPRVASAGEARPGVGERLGAGPPNPPTPPPAT